MSHEARIEKGKSLYLFLTIRQRVQRRFANFKRGGIESFVLRQVLLVRPDIVVTAIGEFDAFPAISLQAVEHGEIVVEIQLGVDANPPNVVATFGLVGDARGKRRTGAAVHTCLSTPGAAV